MTDVIMFAECIIGPPCLIKGKDMVVPITINRHAWFRISSLVLNTHTEREREKEGLRKRKLKQRKESENLSYKSSSGT